MPLLSMAVGLGGGGGSATSLALAPRAPGALRLRRRAPAEKDAGVGTLAAGGAESVLRPPRDEAADPPRLVKPDLARRGQVPPQAAAGPLDP